MSHRSHKDIDEAEQLLASAQRLWERTSDFYSRHSTTFNVNGYTTRQLTDLGFLFREFSEKFDDLRKEATKRQELCGKKIAFDVMTAGLAGEDPEDPVQGELATGKPDMQMEAEVPKKGTPEYIAFLRHFKVPEEVIASQLVNPDWKGLSKRVTELAKDGKPAPPGVGRMFPKYFTTFIRRRAIAE